MIVLLRSGGGVAERAALVGYVALAIGPYANLFGITDPARQTPIVVAGMALLFGLVLFEIAVRRSAPISGSGAS